MSRDDDERPPPGRADTIQAAPLGLVAEPKPGTEAAPGDVFACRYEIETLLGEGGMGAVYRAKDRLVGETVALKRLGAPLRGKDESLEMFRSEVRLARKVTHPNVVRIHDLDEHDGQLFITMEFVLGRDLRAELEAAGGRLEASRAARILADVAEALAAAHAVGVVHSDLKPENILLELGGRVLLTDFGIARAHDVAQGRAKAAQVVGTPAYMAPEQVAGEVATPAADVYAFGIVLFEMLAGMPPFAGDNPIQIAVARLHQDAPDVRTRGAVPEALARIVDACLVRDPALRTVTAADVADGLATYLVETGAAPLVVGPRSASVARAARTGKITRGVAVGMPFTPSDRSLACLPFAYRGPKDDDFLGEAVSGELVDVLSRTRGLKVLSSGAVAKVAHERDPATLARELGVDFVIDGAIQLAGGRLRIVVRLCDASGIQLSSERFDVPYGDIFEVQEKAAQRIAEALRLELSTAVSPEDVPRAAIELYLRARRILRSGHFEKAVAAFDLLEQALADAPEFAPALAAHAHAAVQVWFLPTAPPNRNWGTVAAESVARALAKAPEVPETHVAAARHASHRGELREAVVALEHALRLAPTSAEALGIMGLLEVETGRVNAGLARLKAVQEIEPTGNAYFYERARMAGLAGDKATFDEAFLEHRKLDPGLGSIHLVLRYGAWNGEVGYLRAAIDEAPRLGPGVGGVVATFAKAFLGEVGIGVAVDVATPILAAVNLRFGALIRQILVEIHAARGDDAGAIVWLRALRSTLLYDVPWLERCPLLARLRTRADVSAIVAEVRTRSESVWTAG